MYVDRIIIYCVTGSKIEVVLIVFVLLNRFARVLCVLRDRFGTIHCGDVDSDGIVEFLFWISDLVCGYVFGLVGDTLRLVRVKGVIVCC